MKMFGIGDGIVDIKVNKINFKRGESIEGEVLVELVRPVKALWLNLHIIGEHNFRWHEQGEARAQTQFRQVYEYKLQLDGQKEYPPNKKMRYKFKVKTPQDFTEWKKKGTLGPFGALEGAVDKISKEKNIPVNWYILARLDKAWKFSTYKRIDIKID